MTVEAFSSLPFSAGGAVATGAGRVVLWAVGLYMRQPLRNTALAALIGLSSMAGANVLYKQAHHHPSPMFGSFADAPAPAKVVKAAKTGARPVMPLQRPNQLAATDSETTGSVNPAPALQSPAISNSDVLAMQQKLIALKLLTGTADGMFGRQTAGAIKAFEQKSGRTPRGLLTRQIIDLILAAPLDVPAEQASATAAEAEPASAVQPLPAPAPLVAGPSTELTASSGTETMPMTKPNTPIKHTVQTIAVHAEPAQAIPAPLAPDETAGDASTDPEVVANVQRGLNSLGFLHGEIDGVAGEDTAKAIRNFEVYYNYNVTGRVSKGLVQLLVQNGALI